MNRAYTGALLAPLCISMLSFLVGCEALGREGPVVVASGTDFGILLPVAETSALDGEINSQLYLSLNQARWEDGRLDYFAGPLSLSERWEFGPDSTTLTYYLRPSAVWSDGEPVGAEDVVFTFELVRRPEIASPHAEVWEHIDSVRAGGEHEVTFYFERRYPGMLFDTGLAIVPAHIFAEAADDNATLTSHPTLADPDGNLIVSGPFRVAEWQRGDRLVLERNPSSSTVTASLDTVIFRIITEETTRFVELENEKIDVLTRVPLARAGDLLEDDRFRIETIADRFHDYIAWNGVSFPPFADPAVREALSLAIDRNAILAGLGIAGHARPAAGPYPPVFETLADPTLEPDPYRPDSARTILAAAGWEDVDGDGELERNDAPLSFTLLTQAGNERRTSAAEIIQAGYAEVGIDMEIQALEFDPLLARVFQDKDFDAVLMGWQVGLQPDYLVGHFWPPEHPFNITGYGNSALDSLMIRAQAAETAAEAAPHWRAAARLIAADRPYAFLWFFDDPVVVSQRLENTRIDTYGLFQNLYAWRIRE